MDIDLAAFHFLRPLWLLLALLGIALLVLWNRARHSALRAVPIAPHLLKSLLTKPGDTHRLRPIHLLAALLILGGLAAAGPTWQQDRPDFLENRAPLILAVDLSPSMDASDVPPSRMQAVKHKMHDLIQRRAGAKTGLIAYAGTAHLVLPATQDPQLLDTFLQALSTELIETPGKDVAGVIEQAKRLLAAEDSPGTLLLLTDGAEVGQLDEVVDSLKQSDLQVLILAVGSQNGGMLRDAEGQPRVDANGRPLLAQFDAEALKQLSRAADAPLGSLTLDDDDLEWVELHAQQHLQAANGDDEQVYWKDAGYWLCWPLALIAFFGVRRGWSVNWLAGLLAVALGGFGTPAQAGALADAFFTADQQGRWAFEHGHFPQAAKHFHDPYWKGLAAYRSADYDTALASFARLDSAPAYFYLGNTYAHLLKYPAAIAAYRQALELQPQFPEASANLALAIALQKDFEEQQEVAPEMAPDKIEFDKQAGKGKKAEISAQQSASDALWLQNLTTSPAKFLQQKFRIQSARQQPGGTQP
ncbi:MULTISPECIES: VWA domain-containing protein [unclassified Pseudomonas]|uniref:VWA domain-containing protein n=1 Tax=unclassified Pseudomonas TaxID=196821 RepID=UPI002446FC75|nr:MULTISPECIES: VWA domain-containing protein [unclassified Pseudomonas]MDG9925683.1 VWA domain-containing protein [Pseudomonas sp. GD04045]MDH0037200.1 VWA domain-containing protein [Pseudomonas sp. GD04019]